MMMWIGILIISLVAIILALCFLTVQFSHFASIQKIAKDKPRKQKLCGFLCVLFLCVFCYTLWGMGNLFFCMMHLALIWLVLWLFLRKSRYLGILAITVTIIVLSVGAYNALHVATTYYRLETDKHIGNIRVLQFADAHVGTTFGPAKFREHIQMMNAQNPDIVVITGDFIDGSSGKEDMLGCCEALKDLSAPGGVYFAYGNHDKGYSMETQRGYTADDFERALQNAGVIILEDQIARPYPNVCIVGRMDKSEHQRRDLSGETDGERMTMADLLSLVSDEEYSIVLDHQPGDYDAEEDAGADLVLSGHTHGGQFFPLNEVGVWIGANDKTYGYERRGHTDFIVTSGIADWSFLFRTGCKSEIVVTDLCGK